MTTSSPCPSDRSELIAILEDHASHTLRSHVDGCERCRTEVHDLRSALDLVSPAAEAPPSRRVRREAISYARSQVRGRLGRSSPWRAPAAAMIAAALAMLSGQLAGARLSSSAPPITSPEPWTLVLAAVWSVALFLYATPGGSTPRREVVARGLTGVAAFTVLLLAFPISTAVALCAGWAFGPGQVTPGEVATAYAIMASLYAAVPAALVSRIRGVPSPSFWSHGCGAGLVFAVLAGPLLLVQAAGDPSIAGLAGLGGLACGAWFGGRVGSRR